MVIGNPITLGGGGGGFAVTVRHCGANATVRAYHGAKQETAVADADGVAVFEKLGRGIWTFVSSKFPARRAVEIKGITTTSILPNEFSEVEYIENTGTQSIDTGRTMGGFACDLDVAFTNGANTEFLGTVATQAARNYIGLINRRIQLGIGTSYPLFDTIELNRKYKIAFSTIVSHERYMLDGVETSVAANSGSRGNYSFGIFKNGDGMANAQTGRIYECIVYNDTNKTNCVFSFVPCRRDSDGAFGLYDLVDGQFYTNSGTGEFLHGEEVEQKNNGLIICTAPIGSSVTATNGSQTFKADKTLMGDNEIHVISIKPEYFSANPITVTCVKADGTSTTREAVIDSKRDVELKFTQLWLFKDGDQCIDITGGWTSIDGSGVNFENGKIVFATSSQAARIRTKKTIPAKRFKELHISISTYTSASWIIACMGANSNITPGSSVAPTEISWTLQKTAGVQNFPISDAISDAVFFAIGGNQPRFHVDKIWLE